MAIQNVTRFSHSNDLKSISPQCLAQLLSPHTDFLKSRGLRVPESGTDAGNLDYTHLSNILMAADLSVPGELVNALHYIHETAAPEVMEYLLKESERVGIYIDSSELTPADLAVRLWLAGGHVLEHRYGERFLIKPCASIYYQEKRSYISTFREPCPSLVRAFEGDLDEQFDRTKRGRGCRVYVYTRTDGIWFLVWHGGTYRREGCIVHGESSCVCYRPELYDMLVYQPTARELRINAGTHEDRQIYRKLFGRHFFGDDNHFPGTAIYTLEPLRTDGKRALVCSDVVGMELVTLRRIEFVVGGMFRLTETWEADDLLAAMNGAVNIPHNSRLVEGGFSIKFSDSKIPRDVALRPSNMIYYQRDSDRVMVEPWLRLRGFARNGHLLLVFLLGFVYCWLQDIDAVLSCLPDGIT